MSRSISGDKICLQNAKIAFMDYEIQLQAPDPHGVGYITGTTMCRDEIVHFDAKENFSRVESVYDYDINRPQCISYNPNVQEVVLESYLMKAYPKQVVTPKYNRKYSNNKIYKINLVICQPKICSIEILTPNALVPIFITSYLVRSRYEKGDYNMLKKSDIYDAEWGYSFQLKTALKLKHFGIRGEIEFHDSRDAFKMCEKYEFPWRRVKYSLAFGFHQAVKTGLGKNLISTSNKVKEAQTYPKNKAVTKDISEMHQKYQVNWLNKATLGFVHFSKTISIQKIFKNVSNPLKIIKEPEYYH
uniref:Vitellogenin domain-containing protein n=1 Tax=Strongyloides venezuelensis TaxID=75913 RepID=A0A0K0F586_STRVS